MAGTSSKFRREIILAPHGRWTFYLHGEKGVMQFVVSLMKFNESYFIEPIDIGYHSPVSMYKDQRSMLCHILGTCYYDGSTMPAVDLMERFYEEGEEAVWKYLEDQYERTFQDGNKTQ